MGSQNTLALGDAGTSNSDTSYAGIVEDPSAFSLDYYRAQFVKFQAMMNALDTAYGAAQTALYALDPDKDTDIDTYQQLYDLVLDYEAKRGWVKGVAETINMAANAANAVGMRMPVLSIPKTLGNPLIVGAGVVAAIAAVAYWGKGWIDGASKLIKNYMLLNAIDDADKRAALASAMQQSDAALEQANTEDTLDKLGSISKWVAFGVAAYMGWKLYREHF